MTGDSVTGPTLFPTIEFLTQLSAGIAPLSSPDEKGRRCRRQWSSSGSSRGSGGWRPAPHGSMAAGPPSTAGLVPQYWSSLADTHTDEGEELDAARPQFSFTCLIGLAVLASEPKRLSVVQIYEYIVRNFPYYKAAKTTWRNSVRHVLSLGKFFRKPQTAALRRSGGQPVASKGSAWEIVPETFPLLIEHIAEGQQRLPAATCRHLGLPELKQAPAVGRTHNFNRIGKGRPQLLQQAAKARAGPGPGVEATERRCTVPTLDLDELEVLTELHYTAGEIETCLSDDGLGDSISSTTSASAPAPPSPVPDQDLQQMASAFVEYDMLGDFLRAMDAAAPTQKVGGGGGSGSSSAAHL